MKTYIFATDFSKHAKSALAFTLPFIKKLKGQLLLFHAFEYPNPHVEVPVYMMEEMNEELEKKANNELIKWKKMVSQWDSEIPCRYIAKQGSLVDRLLELSEQENPGAIFMGTKGASGLKRLIFGTNTASVIGRSTCPVLAIPQETAFTGINSIVFATDYQEANTTILDQIAEIASIFEAKLEILYVAIEGMQVNLEVYDWYQEIVKERLSALAPTFQVVQEESVHAGISKYVALHQPDLVVMAMHEKTWLERLISGSNSKRQAYMTEKPLLVFHEGVKETKLAEG